MKRSLFTLLLMAGLISTNLLAQHEHSGHKAQSATTEKAATSPAFQKQLAGVFTAYTGLQEALVASDAGKAKTQIKAMQEALGKTDMQLLQGQAHQQWMTRSKELNGHLNQMAKAGDLAAQRQHFAPLSEAMHHSIKEFGISGPEAYYQYCPMALNNQGAYWLSTTREIKNPYFGEKMLKCGQTKEVIN